MKKEYPPLIAAPEIQAVAVQENSDPLIDLSECSALSVISRSEQTHFSDDYTFVRQSIAAMLIKAQSYLPQGLHLRLVEGYRSLETQENTFHKERERVKTRNPQFDDEAIFRETTKLVSPVFNLDGTVNIPPHSTGGAVDVDIIDESDNILDFGMRIEDWESVSSDYCYTYYSKISTEARNHRQLLLKVMENAGFINYFTEWWHYSYGDKYWAYMTDQPYAIYDSVEPSTNVTSRE